MRLRFRKQFQRMSRGAEKFSGQWIIAEISLSSTPFSRLGITATKKFGKAFQRNRFKRIVREAFRLSCRNWIYPIDIVVRPRTQALQAGTAEIQEELIQFAAQALRKSEPSSSL